MDVVDPNTCMDVVDQDPCMDVANLCRILLVMVNKNPRVKKPVVLTMSNMVPYAISI